MEDVSDPEEGTSWQYVPTSPLEDTECQDGELESMEVEETTPEWVHAYRKSVQFSTMFPKVHWHAAQGARIRLPWDH